MQAYGTIIDNKLVVHKDIDMVINRTCNTLLIIWDKGTMVLKVDDVNKAIMEDDRPF